MLYLNVSSSLPKIATRSQMSKLGAHVKEAELHTHYRAPRADVAPKGLKLDINTYPSRHAYGFTTMDDFCRENRDKALSDIVETTSKHTQAAWDVIENGAKPRKNVGSFFQTRAKQDLKAEVMKQRYIEVQGIPDPEIHVTPYHVAGDIDPGEYSVDITTPPDGKAAFEFQKGSFEMYTKEAGSFRMWVSEGRYDMKV